MPSVRLPAFFSSSSSSRRRVLAGRGSSSSARWSVSASPSRAGPEASVLKVRGTEVLQAITELALRVEGLYGAVHDPADLHAGGKDGERPTALASALAHQYLYGRCWSIFGGTNEIQRNIIAASILR